MPRAIALSALALAIAGTGAGAADLPAHTRLGAVFAEPYVPRVYAERDTNYPTFVFAPQVDIRPIVGGYYGKPFSYYYKPYYGDEATALTDAYTRLPYACGFYGYC
ncbi:hypothetical protein [Bradyrhizobium sp. LHD-71]|uniref:hypothetical protein n=1 Tax=Bradyrhizobium sp. LHD-71 TaxID=3072141 RepID=UPI00280E9803|nr:hypothetical protein [Bradyrhizobium sp. LHD-71]MDQ8726132.1 hypothetical protein [Bradyrhizobium sp. LHD-71]